MKILLFGEYSGFNNTLKIALKQLGHNVLLSGRCDGFKKYPLDIALDPVFFDYKIPKLFKVLFFKLFKYDLAGIEVFYNFLRKKSNFKDFDIVHIINPYPIQTHPFLEKKVLTYLFKHNTKAFLSACGDDAYYIDFLFKNKTLPYHILTPYFKDNSLKHMYRHSLMYTKTSHKTLHEFMVKNVQAIIPSDLDYYIAYKHHKKATPLIPFPINIDDLKYQNLEVDDEIIIFHGVNRGNYYKKGNNYFDEALDIIKKKFAKKVKILRVENLPYADYKTKYNECHILLDQVYAYDQGYNALEAMAKGKVVFTGAEQEWLEYYNVKENTIAINALPDVNKIVEKLEWLILNPNKITEISKNAKRFIEQEHHYITIAEKYIEVWKNN